MPLSERARVATLPPRGKERQELRQGLLALEESDSVDQVEESLAHRVLEVDDDLMDGRTAEREIHSSSMASRPA